MTTTQTTESPDTATALREAIEARKLAASYRRQARIIRQEWLDREAAGQAR